MKLFKTARIWTLTLILGLIGAQAMANTTTTNDVYDRGGSNGIGSTR